MRQIILNSDTKDPFKDCRLNRKKVAEVYTNVVEAYGDGFVMAINNAWGEGKTTFIKMWEQHLKLKGFQTLHFNAWENDFHNDALVALLASIKPLQNNKGGIDFDNVLKSGAKLGKVILPSILKGLAAKYVDTETVLSAIENVGEELSKELENQIEEHQAKQESITHFKEELKKFILASTDNRPLVFFVDELDRCKPSYAVEVLEKIKHLFAVEGVVFVLSIDKYHMGGAIKGYYGSESIDTDEYLRRFIDLEVSLPKPNITNYVNFLYAHYQLAHFFEHKERARYELFANDGSFFKKIAIAIFERTKTTLRQQERIVATMSLVLKTFKLREMVFPYILFYLVYIKQMNFVLYDKILNLKLTINELQLAFVELFGENTTSIKGISIVYIEALLIYLYNNDLVDTKKQLYSYRDSKLQTSFSTKFERITNDNFKNAFISISNNPDIDGLRLSQILDRVNLINPITTNITHT